ncbi:gfo/Idh/MocA family oxidoreductase [Pedobacter petrophilus]|uniref:Gfo/Idh/MocA family oxidoreductase n=2 Tax=Pedobacter TaxID=84567 RepID=A0A7K0FZF9_9SPHI|nr:Gfo/Idh/MocA family oxidoreductase [Pedobacter petrophilus]MRX76987.1 gfo/Idh/MocA family oxidoreductase [Pedobacter petrophilus]
MNRRKFVKDTAIATAGITILNFPVFGKNAPSNKVQLAVMGLNGRGSFLASSYAKLENVEIAYICDVEEKAIQKGFNALVNEKRKPTLVRDIHDLVKKTDFDALIVAAPDHWHAPAALLGVANNKHVYVEKPCGHNAHEGELLVQAMSKHKKLIQMGNQRRSFPTVMEAANLLKSGIIGKPYLGKAWYVNNRKSIGHGDIIPVPATLDFNLWQGPAPRSAYKSNLVHYNWHWFWNWGTGEACNNGTHEIDVCRWFLGVDFPTKVTSAGGRYAFKDDWETPDTQIATFEFGKEKAITWESRSCNQYPVEKNSRGATIYAENGTLVYDGAAGSKFYDADNKLIKEIKSDSKADANNLLSSTASLDLYHFQNFVDSIRGNAQLNSPVSEAYKSVLLCHLANISQRTGDTLHCNAANGHIINNKAAENLWSRKYEKGWEPKV